MEVVILGVRDSYNGVPQVAQGAEVTVLSEGNEIPEPPVTEILTVKEVLEAANGTTVTFKGIIVSVEPYAEQYKNQNFIVSDNGVDAIYIFRAPTETAFEVGMEVVVTGTRSSFNDKKEIAEGAEVEVVAEGKEIPVTGLELTGPETVKANDPAFSLDVIFTPEYTTQRDLIWSVDNSEVASIAADGKITPKSVGTVVVTVKSALNEEVVANFTIEVEAGVELPSSINLDFSGLTNKDDAKVWLKDYPGYEQVGNMGKAYNGYAGFKNTSSLLTEAVSMTDEVRIVMVVKGYSGSDPAGLVDNYFTVNALDREGNVIGTAVVVSDSANKSTVGSTQGKLHTTDSTIELKIGVTELVEGKSFGDIARFEIHYEKVTSGVNMGLKTLVID